MMVRKAVKDIEERITILWRQMLLSTPSSFAPLNFFEKLADWPDKVVYPFSK